jgi:hypothetical protein
MKQLEDSVVIVCGIVRNCEKGLKKNVPIINRLCDFARNYHIIIYENDSTDKTKELLLNWAANRKNVYLKLDSFDKNGPIPPYDKTSVHPFYSFTRINRMASLRNEYMKTVDELKLSGDYLIVVDLDVISIDFDGILNSFSAGIEWDAVTAYGYLRFGPFWRIYYDTYALVELDDEAKPQTMLSIKKARNKWANVKQVDPWIWVFSAYGGLAIYRYDAIQGLRYEALPNNDKYVESRCEHYSIYQQMKGRGFDKIFINPAMVIKYKRFSVRKMPSYIFNRYHAGKLK